MLSRSTALRFGAVVAFFAGVVGWVMFPSQRIAAIDGRRMSPGKPAASVRSAKIQLKPESPPLLAVVHDLVARQRRCSPAEPGREDEIRCALANLLTDENAESMVRNLSDGELLSEFGVAALSRWAANEAGAASLWLAQQPVQSNEQTCAVAHVLARDSAALGVLCELLPPTGWREALLESTAYARLPDSPADAVRLAWRLQPSPRRTQVLVAIADEWASRDPVAAGDWIETLPDLRLRDELLLSAATSCAFVDPTIAIHWTAGIASDAVFDRAVDKISSMWTDSSADRAARLTVAVALDHRASTDPSSSPAKFFSSP